jgi:hypothetical protein
MKTKARWHIRYAQVFRKVLIGLKALTLALLCALAGSLVLLSTGCTATEGRHSNVSLLMPGTATTPRAQSGSDQDFYQPPRDPQFNTARDQ